MKKILILLLLTWSVISCATTDDLIEEVVDAADEKAVMVAVEEAPKTDEAGVDTGEVIEPEETIEPVVEAAPEKILPTEQEIVDLVKEYDLEGLTELLADIDDVKAIVGDDVLLCHMAEESMGMTAVKNELLALLVEKKAYILQVDNDKKSMRRYVNEMGMGGTERSNYIDEVIGDKFQVRINALRSDDLETIMSMTEYFPVDAYLLQSAVEEKATKVALWVIEQGIPVSGIAPETGDSLLHIACNGKPYNHLFDERVDLVKNLLAEGLDVNLKNKKGDTPIAQLFLVQGGKNGNMNLLAKVLLDAGADVNTVTSKNLSLINHATRLRYDELVRLLLDEGAVIDDNTLNDMNLTPAAMTMFLEKGANPDAFTDNLMIFFSDYEAQFDFIKNLLDRGASLPAFNLPDVRKNVDALKYLIEQGADVNDGNILQSFIVEFQDLDTLDYLVLHGADLEKTFYNDMTAMHFAVKYKQIEAVVYLIEQGVELNPVDLKGNTPLDYCSVKNENLMNVLLDAGAKKSSDL